MRVLITGASSGVGEAIAYECAKRGDSLHLCGRDTARLEAVAAKCRELGAPAVEARRIDVRDEDAMRDWISAASAEGPFDRVFANAGVSTGDETEPNARNTFSINVNGTVNTVYPAIAAKTRHIIITSSVAGFGPLKACPSYSATKACIRVWGLSLRGMLRSEGIKVSVIAPGFIRSRITDANTCPMPFFLEADVAARKIIAGVDRNRALISFPWQMRFATWFIAVMPTWLNELVNRLLPSKVI